jgi:uncharacterized protein (DUF305 family)
VTAVRRRRALPFVVAMAIVAGCGHDDNAARPDAATLDDAFVARIVPQQHVAAALADTAVREARTGDVRRLARKMRAMRRRTLPTLDDRLTRVPGTAKLPDLGVSAQQAADEVTPQALSASRPIDTAYLTIMARHDHGALALVKAELDRGKDQSVKASAQRLAAELTRELALLSDALQAAGRTSSG